MKANRRFVADIAIAHNFLVSAPFPDFYRFFNQTFPYSRSAVFLFDENVLQINFIPKISSNNKRGGFTIYYCH